MLLLSPTDWFWFAEMKCTNGRDHIPPPLRTRCPPCPSPICTATTLQKKRPKILSYTGQKHHQHCFSSADGSHVGIPGCLGLATAFCISARLLGWGGLPCRLLLLPCCLAALGCGAPAGAIAPLAGQTENTADCSAAGLRRRVRLRPH